MKLAFPVLLSSLLSSASTVTMVTATPEEVYSLHGSGTTNPSKCYWSIMERMQARSQQNIRVTYRAVGSTAGQDEFINNGTAVATDTFESTTLVDFASGDIPLTMARYNVASDANIDVIQLPVVLGAVTFFHSVEDANGEPIAKLNLTACVLADIFTGEITEWDHPDIKALNDNLDLPDGDDNTITVARRVKGSSSTDSVTKYLRKACPGSWPEALTGSKPDWPAEPTIGCQGSSGVTTCIRKKVGTIGYLDAGHGISAGLDEIQLQNEAKTVQNSQDASAKGGIEAAEGDSLPNDPTDDISSVSLLDQPGEFTWPIVQMSYIYVRKDLTYMEEPNEQSLLVAFLKAVYDDDYSSDCYKNFGFTRVSEATRTYALNAIDSLIVNDTAAEWIFESDTLPYEGAGNFVISTKRNNFLAVSTSSLTDMTADIEEDITSLNKQLLDAGEEILKLEAELKDFAALAAGNNEFTDDDAMQLKAALAMSSVSFILTLVGLVAWTVGSCRGLGTRSTKSNADITI